VKGLFEVDSVEETWELAARFADELRPGDVVCLEGELGAGKTTFTQGLAAALGVSGRVTSPTFCIVQEHRFSGKCPRRCCGDAPRIPLLVHMDLYRLSGEEDVEAIGWEDYLSRGAVLVVEWPDRAGGLVPESARHVSILHGEGEENRKILIDSNAVDGV